MSEEISNEPKTPLEAAIDKATGYVPGEESRVASDAEQDGTGEGGGAEAAEVRTAGETKPADGETKSAEAKENAASVKEKRDWVEEAYECFVKNAVDMEPTDPVKAIAAYFEKNATDELKAKAKAEGKTAEGCWKFIEKVARKALGGRSGHIDPVTVYAIAMHYFQDVPKDWDEAKVNRAKDGAAQVGRTAKGKAKDGKKAKPKAKDIKKAKPKAKKGGKEQGFFFDLLETEPVGPDQEGEKNEVR